MQPGGVSLISYRPSQVQPALLAQLDQWILTCTRLPEERKILERYLPGFQEQMMALNPLATFSQGQACFVKLDPTRSALAAAWIPFRAGPRAVPHIRHLNKYLQAPLPAAKRFYFCDPAGRFAGRVASSLGEFRAVLADAPAASLDYHVYRGDFERWLREVLHDEELARRLRKLAHRGLHGEELRTALYAVVDERYNLLVSLA